MIDLLTERVISLRDAAKLLPARRQGKRPTVSCLFRWTTRGCRGVILESVQIGGTRCTSAEALTRFFAALSAPAERQLPPNIARRRQQSDRALRELIEEGL